MSFLSNNTEEDEQKKTSSKKSLFLIFYQILKGVYTSHIFETCFVVANDDLKGKTTHFTGFCHQKISEPKIPKTAHSVTQRDAIETDGHFKCIKKHKSIA